MRNENLVIIKSWLHKNKISFLGRRCCQISLRKLPFNDGGFKNKYFAAVSEYDNVYRYFE